MILGSNSGSCITTQDPASLILQLSECDTRPISSLIRQQLPPDYVPDITLTPRSTLPLTSLTPTMTSLPWWPSTPDVPPPLTSSPRNTSSTSRASRRAELSQLLAGGEGRDSPLAASSEDLSTRSTSPRYNSTLKDETLA